MLTFSVVFLIASKAFTLLCLLPKRTQNLTTMGFSSVPQFRAIMGLSESMSSHPCVLGMCPMMGKQNGTQA